MLLWNKTIKGIYAKRFPLAFKLPKTCPVANCGNDFDKEIIVFSEMNRLLTDWELIRSDVTHGAAELYLPVRAVITHSGGNVIQQCTWIMVRGRLHMLPYLPDGIISAGNYSLNYHAGFWVSIIWCTPCLAILTPGFLAADWRTE